MRLTLAGLCNRLVFNEDLARPMTLTRNPYHFCAINGYSGLAAFLHTRGISHEEFGHSIRVAGFLGDGVNNSTPWEKFFDVSPADAALLAGNSHGTHWRPCTVYFSMKRLIITPCRYSCLLPIP